jgi:hypothetical protein
VALRPALLVALALLGGCGVFGDAQRPAPAGTVATTRGDAAVAMVLPRTDRVGTVEVVWDDASRLTSPRREAEALSASTYAELRRRGLASEDAPRVMRVRVFEMLLHGGGMQPRTNVLSTRLYLLDGQGEEQWNAPLRVSVTTPSGGTRTPEAQLDALYERYAQRAAETWQQRLPAASGGQD